MTEARSQLKSETEGIGIWLLNDDFETISDTFEDYKSQ